MAASASIISSDAVIGECSSIGHIQQKPWRGCFHAVVRAPLSRVWDATRRFASVHTWAPSVVSRCRLVEGEEEDRVGCVRVCDGVDGNFLGRERLLAMDDASHLYSYVVEDSIIPGLTGYISTFQLHHHRHPSNIHVCSCVPASNIKNNLHPPPHLPSNDVTRDNNNNNIPFSHPTTFITWSYRVPPIASTSSHDFQQMMFGYYARCINDLEKYLLPNP